MPYHEYDEKKNDDFPAKFMKEIQANKRRRNIIIAAAILLGFWFLRSIGGGHSHKHHQPNYLIPEESRSDPNRTIPFAAFQPPEDVAYRRLDTTDAFESYKYRQTCNISSLDLHTPFAPLCQTRQDMLDAMSWGGRIGHDAPYMPRGCDMRWFTTEEACEILGRFHKIIVLGDSMMRHVIGSLNVIMRKDLGYGAVTDWNFSPEERRDCFCNYQFNVKACSIQGIFKTSDVLRHDPSSFHCDPNNVNVVIEVMVRYPIAEEELERFKLELGHGKPNKPIAFIFGHGLWNDLDLQAHLNWLDTILDLTKETLPWIAEEGALWPRLVVTPNAAGKNKPDEFLVSQGNKALSIFEDAVRVEDGSRGVEHLGTFNMSVQANMYDGGHCDLRGNLVKAMMVLNWLNMVEVDKHR